MRIPWLCALLLTLLCAAGCRKVAAPGAARAPVFAQSRDGGLVWKVSGGQVPVFLAGSLHLLEPSDVPYPWVYGEAYRQSHEVWFEVAPTSPTTSQGAAETATAMKLPAGTTIEGVLSRGAWSKLQTAPTFGAKKDSWLGLRPWAVAVDVAMEAYRRVGARPDLGLDRALQKLVLAEERPTGGFETGVQQIQLLSEMKAEEQEALLVQALTEAETAPVLVKSLLQEWRKGDEVALGRLLDDGFAEFPQLKERLVLQRNRSWLPKVERLTMGEQPAMVVVGCGHLCGKGSLVELLREKKFHVERIPDAPGTSPGN